MSTPIAEVRNSSDLKELEHLLHGLIGQTCWKAKFTYGDELALHFGARIPCGNPRMPNLENGSWILGTRATPWRLDLPDKKGGTSADARAVLQPRLAALEGARVVRAAVPSIVLNGESPPTSHVWPGLFLAFDTGLSVQLLPGIEELRDTLSLWELFTPGNMVLEFSPDLTWSYIRSDVPEGVQTPVPTTP